MIQMKRTIIGIVLFGCSLLLAAQSRIVRNLNDGWKFHAGEIENGAALSLDDSGWRTLDLPHDFQIEQPWVPPSAD
jgi:beta-galactosidase